MTKIFKDENDRIIFTKEMKENYTILCPMMAPIHFSLIVNVLRHYGYTVELLETNHANIIQEGLKYVHNDICYPALLVIGQFIDALKSGKYNPEQTALIISQTGGGCRASNYIYLLRKALKKAGFDQVPVISLNLSKLENNPGFKLTVPMIRKIIPALVYGDALMLLENQTKPYEICKGDTVVKTKDWIQKLSAQLNKGKWCSLKKQKKILQEIVADYIKIPIKNIDKVKVGIVGEIYIKYAALGNNNLEEFLAKQNCEVNMSGILHFVMFKVDNRLDDIRLYGGNKVKFSVIQFLMNYLEKMQNILTEAVQTEDRFQAPATYKHVKSLVKNIIGYGNKMGEGWLLTAEMLELIESGYENIVCAQPFGCLPNHICGKGMLHKIKEMDSRANIVPIDYDPGATKVNQENRIQLMLSVARENLEAKKINCLYPQKN